MDGGRRLRTREIGEQRIRDGMAAEIRHDLLPPEADRGEWFSLKGAATDSQRAAAGVGEARQVAVRPVPKSQKRGMEEGICRQICPSPLQWFALRSAIAPFSLAGMAIPF